MLFTWDRHFLLQNVYDDMLRDGFQSLFEMNTQIFKMFTASKFQLNV